MLAAACAVAPICGADPPSPETEFQAGKALFEGGADLHGRIRTHVADLPPAVVRCANCHALADGPAVPSSLAPRLSHELLLVPRARRGGPPSFYDRRRFCRLLREGVDPTLTLINLEMPQYALDDQGCRALWRFVTANGHEPGAH